MLIAILVVIAALLLLLVLSNADAAEMLGNLLSCLGMFIFMCFVIVAVLFVVVSFLALILN